MQTDQDVVLDSIEKIIRERKRTDTILDPLYIVHYVIVIFISVVLAYYEPIAIILGMLATAVIYYHLIWRINEHLKREKKLFDHLILWLKGKTEDWRINNINLRLRDRKMHEAERNPLLWSMLIIVLGILGAIFSYGGDEGLALVILIFLGIFIIILHINEFLMNDLNKHDKVELFLLEDVNQAMTNVGEAFSVPAKPEIPKRNFSMYGFLTFFTVFFSIYWLYVLFKDPNVHFENQKEWEDELLLALRRYKSVSEVTAPEHPIAEPRPKVAKLVLPTREIELSEDEMMLGREDFEEDLPKEDLLYVSIKVKPQFKITRNADKFYILDDSSAGGTMLNGVDIKGKGKHEIEDNDEIIIAGIDDFKIFVKLDTPPEKEAGIICAKCGAENKMEYDYCRICGTKGLRKNNKANLRFQNNKISAFVYTTSLRE